MGKNFTNYEEKFFLIVGKIFTHSSVFSLILDYGFILGLQPHSLEKGVREKNPTVGKTIIAIKEQPVKFRKYQYRCF